MDTKIENSVIITIVLSIAGIVWAIVSYTLFTKWFCCYRQADPVLHGQMQKREGTGNKHD